jgi:hypothetical protein
MTDPKTHGAALPRLCTTQRLGIGAALAVLFALSMTVYPLYHSDQLIYFVHALAEAGFGRLHDDWAAALPSPYPVFGALVYVTYSYLHPALFYVFLLICMGVYAAMQIAIPATALRPLPGRAALLTAGALLISLHSQPLDDLVENLLPLRPIDFYHGLGGQYLITTQFIPSSFGVLLLLSIFLFLRGRPYAAAVTVAATVSFHPAMMLVGATLITAYMAEIALRQKRPLRALATGAVALVLTLPILVHAVMSVQPTTPEIFTQAQEIFRFVRTPKSQDPRMWLTTATGVKLALVCAALWLTRRTPLFTVMVIPFAVGVGLTLLQIATNSNDLALLVPWRVMAVLVPLSTALLLTAGVSAVLRQSPPGRTGLRHAVLAGALLALALAVYAGGRETLERFGRDALSDPQLNAFDYLRAHATAGDLYLIPPDMEDFRLGTGQPIFVDFKVFPLRDVDILEWHKRLKLANRYYNSGIGQRETLLRGLAAEYGITHVVFRSADVPRNNSALEPEFANRAIAVFRVTGAR